MPIPKSYATLVNLLYQRTDAGKVNWHKTATASTVAVYFEDFALMISERRSSYDNEVFVRVALVDTDGDEIDVFIFPEDDEDYAIMSGLYTAARRKALRIDDALNTMLHELEQSDEVGSLPPEDDVPF